MIISPVCEPEDVAYCVYDTVGRLVMASAYSCGVYDEALEKSHKKIKNKKIFSSLLVLYQKDTLFDSVELQQKIPQNPFAIVDAYLKCFSQHVQ